MRRVASLLVLCVLAIPAVVDAQISSSSLVLSPAFGPAGSSVTVSGSGLPANAEFTARWNQKAGVVLASGATDASGNFSATLTIPATAGAGDHSILVCAEVDGDACGRLLTATFTVISASDTTTTTLVSRSVTPPPTTSTTVAPSSTTTTTPDAPSTTAADPAPTTTQTVAAEPSTTSTEPAELVSPSEPVSSTTTPTPPTTDEPDGPVDLAVDVVDRVREAYPWLLPLGVALVVAIGVLVVLGRRIRHPR